jgi:hypothetical protein
MLLLSKRAEIQQLLSEELFASAAHLRAEADRIRRTGLAEARTDPTETVAALNQTADTRAGKAMQLQRGTVHQVTDLYNEYAHSCSRWGACLLLMQHAGLDNAQEVAHLWSSVVWGCIPQRSVRRPVSCCIYPA